MLCPACKKALLIVEFEGVELDACVDGHGLWFDIQELRQLFEISGLPDEVLDLEGELTALPRRGARRRCPRCRARMHQVAAPERDEDIILDRCPRGDGLWFDQGELMALLACLLGPENDALERIRGFLGQAAGTARAEHDGASGPAPA